MDVSVVLSDFRLNRSRHIGGAHFAMDDERTTADEDHSALCLITPAELSYFFCAK